VIRTRALLPDQMLDAAVQIDALRAARDVLNRYRLPTVDVDHRIAHLTRGLFTVVCYVCCKNTVTVVGLARPVRPICTNCLSAACDEPYCFAPATVAITTAAGTSVCCTVHGFAVLPADGRVVVQHLTNGADRRAACDERVRLARAS